MDSIDLLHAGRPFKIIFEDDLTFVEVRSILDCLLAERAFDYETQLEKDGYNLYIDEATFSVWVSENRVVIQRD
jgi:hypothetical protein